MNSISTSKPAADAVLGRHRWLGLDRSTLIQYGLALLTIVLVFSPIVPVLYQSVIDRPLYVAEPNLTLDNYSNLVLSDNFWTIVQNTLLFAVMATVIATAVGATTAILVGRTDLPGRRILGDLMLWPVFVSQLVLALGWFMIYGPSGYMTLLMQNLIGFKPWDLYTIPGMALVAGVAEAPLAFLYCIASTAMNEGTLEDAARTCGSKPFRTLRTITLPMLRPAIMFSAILIFSGTLETLSIPLIFGTPARIELFSTLLYSRGYISPRPDYGLVATAAVVLLVVIMALLLLQQRMLRNNSRYVTVGGKASRPRTFNLGPLRWPVFGVVLFYVVFFVVLPLLTPVLRASVSILSPLVPFWNYFTFKNFAAILSSESELRAIANTLFLAVVGGAVGTIFVALLAIVAQRSEFRFRKPLEYIVLFPRAIPGLVAGMGFFYAMALVPPLGWLRNSLWILMFAYIMRYLPVAYGALSPSLLQISGELNRSARVSGADWWTTTRAIVLPLMKPALFSSYALLFIYFFKEYTTAVFLFSTGSEVLGSVLLNAWSNGDTGGVAALSSIQIVMTIVFVALARKVFGVKLYN